MMSPPFPLRQRLNLQRGSCLHIAAKCFAGLIALLAAVTVLGVSLTGCDTAVKKPSTDAQPPDDTAEPAPTLLGTWERTTVGPDDDGTVGTEKQTVTITDTHFIELNLHLDADGVEIGTWGAVGTVSISAASVTLMRFEDDGETAPVEKEYVIVDGSLFIHHWESPDPEANFDRFTRVGDPPMPGASPLPLRGYVANNGQLAPRGTRRDSRIESAHANRGSFHRHLYDLRCQRGPSRVLDRSNWLER